jgi:hypothetical protein
VSQFVNLGPALSGLSTGLKISGYNYRFRLMSAAGDTLTASFITKDNAGNAIDTTNVNFSGINTNGAFTADAADPQGTVTYDKLYSPTSLGSFTASFTGKDTKFWAGLYGPRVRDFNVGFNYTAGGGGSSGSPTVPSAATAIPTSGRTTSSTTDTTKTDAAAVNAGGVEITNGEITVADNMPQVVKDTFVRDANELAEKKKEKTVRAVTKPVEVVLPRRSSQTSSAATAGIQTGVEDHDFTGIRIGAADTRAGGLGLSPTNPLNMFLPGRMADNNDNAGSAGTVKRNVANNELAGGVDIAKLATQPVGFADYMSLTITDAAFYAPREAYANQRVVDNARAQRLLQGASDRLHQDMVNSQYRKNN